MRSACPSATPRRRSPRSPAPAGDRPRPAARAAGTTPTRGPASPLAATATSRRSSRPARPSTRPGFPAGRVFLRPRRQGLEGVPGRPGGRSSGPSWVEVAGTPGSGPPSPCSRPAPITCRHPDPITMRFITIRSRSRPGRIPLPRLVDMRRAGVACQAAHLAMPECGPVSITLVLTSDAWLQTVPKPCRNSRSDARAGSPTRHHPGGNIAGRTGRKGPDDG